MKTVRLPAQDRNGAVYKAAQWLRQYLNTPDYESIDSQFERHFQCRIVRDPPNDFVFGKMYAEFEESEAVTFLLRWL